MIKQSFDTILEECILLLRQGKSVSDCTAIYGGSKALQETLAVVKVGLSIPKKKVELNEKAIWAKISSGFSNDKQNQSAGLFINPFANFRLSFPRPIVSLITLLVIVGLVNATAVAAQNSIPGETLYPVKKTVEKLHLTLTINEEKKTEVRIKHAESRLSEVATIVENKSNGEPIAELGKKDAETVEETLTALVDTTAKISSESEKKKNPDLLEKLVKLTDKQEIVLNQLGTKLSGDTKDAINAALGSAMATEKSAKKNLEELSRDATGITNGNATSTESALTIPSSTTTTTTLPGLPTSTSTSTGEGLEALGEADATSTKEIEPSEEENTSTDLFLEVIEL